MDITFTIFSLIILIISIIFHELAHGATADWMGDSTARLAGRLTLNPIAHMEFVGSFLLPILCVISGSGFIIGWAKPVPFNPRNLKYQRWGPALVAIAGPIMNISLAIIGAIIFHIFGTALSFPVMQFIAMIVTINISLAIFNLIPLPPLDGHHILGAIIPRYHEWSLSLMRGYGLIIMIIVILFAGSLIGPVISFFTKLLLG